MAYESIAADLEEEDEQEGDHDEDGGDGGGPFNIGKAFLIPRVKMSLYDEDIFAPSLLEARDNVRVLLLYCCVHPVFCVLLADFVKSTLLCLGNSGTVWEGAAKWWHRPPLKILCVSCAIVICRPLLVPLGCLPHGFRPN